MSAEVDSQTQVAMTSPPRLYAVPREGIAYVDCLYGALERLGVEAARGDRSARWAFTHVRRGDALHLHWPSTFYHVPESTLQTYLRLARFAFVLGWLKLRGARIFWTAHNLYPHDGGERVMAHRLARKLIAAVVNVVFVHGERAQRLVEQAFPAVRGKTVVIPHGHWIGSYPERVNPIEARHALGLPEHRYIYGFIGNCKPYKGLEELIDAFSALPGDTLLLIAGKFDSQAYLEEIRTRLARIAPERVRLIAKFLSPEELRDCVCSTDALILPYRAILTSGSVMLGLSFGVPVVVSRRGAIDDVVTDAVGEQYDPDDARGLVEAMQRIRTRTFSTDAIVAHARGFDWSTSAGAIARALHYHCATRPSKAAST
jgi:beta-1,4-mannosyltransferase